MKQLRDTQAELQMAQVRQAALQMAIELDRGGGARAAEIVTSAELLVAFMVPGSKPRRRTKSAR